MKKRYLTTGEKRRRRETRIGWALLIGSALVLGFWVGWAISEHGIDSLFI